MSEFDRALRIAILARAALVGGEEPMLTHLADWMCAWQEMRLIVSRQLS